MYFCQYLISCCFPCFRILYNCCNIHINSWNPGICCYYDQHSVVLPKMACKKTRRIGKIKQKTFKHKRLIKNMFDNMTSDKAHDSFVFSSPTIEIPRKRLAATFCRRCNHGGGHRQRMVSFEFQTWNKKHFESP